MMNISGGPWDWTQVVSPCRVLLSTELLCGSSACVLSHSTCAVALGPLRGSLEWAFLTWLWSLLRVDQSKLVTQEEIAVTTSAAVITARRQQRIQRVTKSKIPKTRGTWNHEGQRERGREGGKSKLWSAVKSCGWEVIGPDPWKNSGKLLSPKGQGSWHAWT